MLYIVYNPVFDSFQFNSSIMAMAIQDGECQYITSAFCVTESSFRTRCLVGLITYKTTILRCTRFYKKKDAI